MNIEVVNIDDKNYYVVNELNIENKKYVFLVNEKNNKDIVIRKLKKEDDKEFLIGLDDEKEFDLVMKEYLNKN